MGRKKKEQIFNITPLEVENEISNFVQEVDNSEEYSLEVDPSNKYNLTDEEKNFIKNYVEYKNIPVACELSNIDKDYGKKIFSKYSTQQEIRRINKAMYNLRFKSKLLNLTDIAGYLSSLITDENVPMSDQLKGADKLKAAQMLIDLYKYQYESLKNPQDLMEDSIEAQVKDLSVDSIKSLLYSKEKNETEMEEKEKLIEEINSDDLLTHEELMYLKSLSLSELFKLLNSINKENEKDEL